MSPAGGVEPNWVMAEDGRSGRYARQAVKRSRPPAVPRDTPLHWRGTSLRSAPAGGTARCALASDARAGPDAHRGARTCASRPVPPAPPGLQHAGSLHHVSLRPVAVGVRSGVGEGIKTSESRNHRAYPLTGWGREWLRPDTIARRPSRHLKELAASIRRRAPVAPGRGVRPGSLAYQS
jgi:hypothetical protein